MTSVSLNTEQFRKAIVGDTPVLVEFWAPWCVYCRRISAAYEQVAEQRGEKLIVAKVNIDEEPALVESERVEAVPTLKLYGGGQALGTVVAPTSKAAIDDFISQTLGD